MLTSEHCLWQLDWPELGQLYRGKVRDCYWRQDWGFLITSDRISAFDSVFPQPIPYKGAVLQSLAVHFLQAAQAIMTTHLLDVPDPNVMVVRRAQALPVELVIRGFLTGSAWRDYQAGLFQQHYGQALAPGMLQHQALERPLITPTTKEVEGHDRPIDLEQAAHLVGGSKRWSEIEAKVRALFALGQDWAQQRGLVLVDCKYELGLIGEELVLIDELHTPDSSRYWEAVPVPMQEPRQLSKEFFREWLMSQGAQGIVDIPGEVASEIADRYLELHRRLLGRDLDLAPLQGSPRDRIRAALQSWKDRA